MRYLFLILLTSLLLTGITPANNAWSIEGIDLFCFHPISVQQPAPRARILETSWLRKLLLRPSPRQRPQPKTVDLLPTSLGLRLDERTRFGISPAPATPGSNNKIEEQGPAFNFGLHCLLD